MLAVTICDCSVSAQLIGSNTTVQGSQLNLPPLLFNAPRGLLPEHWMSALRSSASFLTGCPLCGVQHHFLCCSIPNSVRFGIERSKPLFFGSWIKECPMTFWKLRGILRYFFFRIMPAICRVIFHCPIDVVVHGHER